MRNRKSQPLKKKCPVMFKVCYAVKSHAAEQARTRTRLEGIEITFYKCQFCRDYHLTKRRGV